MEKNLEYGDCFNFLGTFFSCFAKTCGLEEVVEKKLDEKAIELFRDKVYPILMRGINKSIKYIDYKLNFYASVDISKIEIPTEYIIDSVKIDFSEKIKMQFKETINLIFN